MTGKSGRFCLVADLHPNAAVPVIIRAMFLVLCSRRVTLCVVLCGRRPVIVAHRGGGMGIALVVARRLFMLNGAILVPGGIIGAVGNHHLGHAGGRRQKRRRQKCRRDECR